MAITAAVAVLIIIVVWHITKYPTPDNPAWSPLGPATPPDPAWSPLGPAVPPGSPAWSPLSPATPPDDPAWSPLGPATPPDPAWSPLGPATPPDPAWSPLEPIGPPPPYVPGANPPCATGPGGSFSCPLTEGYTCTEYDVAGKVIPGSDQYCAPHDVAVQAAKVYQLLYPGPNAQSTLEAFTETAGNIWMPYGLKAYLCPGGCPAGQECAHDLAAGPVCVPAQCGVECAAKGGRCNAAGACVCDPAWCARLNGSCGSNYQCTANAPPAPTCEPACSGAQTCACGPAGCVCEGWDGGMVTGVHVRTPGIYTPVFTLSLGSDLVNQAQHGELLVDGYWAPRGAACAGQCEPDSATSSPAGYHAANAASTIPTNAGYILVRGFGSGAHTGKYITVYTYANAGRTLALAMDAQGRLASADPAMQLTQTATVQINRHFAKDTLPLPSDTWLCNPACATCAFPGHC